MARKSNNKIHCGQAPHLELRRRLEMAGCFRPAPFAYALRTALILSTLLAGYLALLAEPGWATRLILTAMVAFATVQAGFVAHDAGDGAVTRNRRVSLALRHGLMSFVSALSSSYFHYLHRVHHLTLQRGGRGVGGQLQVNPYELSWLKRLLSGNGIVFLVGTVILRGLTFKLESLRYAAANVRNARLDTALIGLHLLVWLALPALLIGPVGAALNYLLITLFAGPYVGTVLVINHEGMAAAHRQAHLPAIERVTKTTRNLGTSRIADFLLGGVNNHIEHHLFPQIPAIRLREARMLTREFCKENGIAYEETTFVQAMAESIRHFRRQSPDGWPPRRCRDQRKILVSYSQPLTKAKLVFLQVQVA